MKDVNEPLAPIDMSTTDWLASGEPRINGAMTRQMRKRLAKPELSVVIPVFNEEDNIEILYEKLLIALAGTGRSWEVIFVDDGSTDRSFEELEKMADSDHRVKVVRSFS